MKKARKSFGEDYDCQKEWPEDCGVQCGDRGVVLSTNGSYYTAFFEAFPKNPSCFLRGEGSSIQEAEEQCWEKYLKVTTCNHEMERRDRRDGYGYCKYCSYSSMVFEPLDKCCKCGIPTRYSVDYKGNHYCKKHNRIKPKDPNRGGIFDDSKRRIPRKRKKFLKYAVTNKFRQDGIKGKVYLEVSPIGSRIFKCGGFTLRILFRKQEIGLIQEYGKKYERK